MSGYECLDKTMATFPRIVPHTHFEQTTKNDKHSPATKQWNTPLNWALKLVEIRSIIRLVDSLEWIAIGKSKLRNIWVL